MGSWNGTCMISNLPIISGERIKVVLLRPSYSRSHIGQGSGYVYSSDILKPSFLQISGQYDDYGMIENIDDDWNSQLIEETLRTKILGDYIIADGKKIENYTLEDILTGIERNDLRFFGVDPDDVKMKKIYEGIAEDIGEGEEMSDTMKYYVNLDTTPKETRLNASWVMIREDIWNHIIENYVGEFYNRDAKGVEDPNFYLSARDWCRKEFNYSLERISKEIEMFGVSDYISSSVFSTLLSPRSYDMVLTKADDELREKIFEEWTQFTIINTFMSHTRIGWMIQPGAGSQTEGWKETKMLAEKIIEICDKGIERFEDWE